MSMRTIPPHGNLMFEYMKRPSGHESNPFAEPPMSKRCRQAHHGNPLHSLKQHDGGVVMAKQPAEARADQGTAAMATRANAGSD
jgi:hypothetical protein